MYRTQLRVIGIHQHIPRQHLRVSIHLLHIINRPCHHPRIVQQLQPMRRILRPESLLQQRRQFRLPRLAIPRSAKPIVVNQIFPPDSAAKLLPSRLRRGPQIQVAVPSPQRLVRRGHTMRRTQRAGDFAIGKIHRRLPYRISHARLHQRSIHQLPLPGLKRVNIRRHNPVGPKQSGGKIRDRHPHFGRRRIRVPRNTHQPAHPLRHQIEPAPVAGRPGAAEP